jgi:drug/metabolite transporter (DMT)-like permease
MGDSAHARTPDNRPMIALAERRATLDGMAVAVLLTCCTLWGLNQVAVKVALTDIAPFTQVAVRSLGAFALVLAWSNLRGKAVFAGVGTFKAGLLAGALFAAEFACIFTGLQYTSASRMVVFIYLSPFVVAAGMPWIAHSERMRPVQWLGLAVAFGGVAIAFGEGFFTSGASQLRWFGDALGIAAGVLWGATTLAIRASSLALAAPEKTLAYQLGVSGLLLALAAPLAGEALPQNVSALSASSMLFQTIVVTFASYLAWFWLVRHYPATRIASFTLLTPVTGLIFGVVLLREPLTWHLLLALACVAAGLVLVNRR